MKKLILSLSLGMLTTPALAEFPVGKAGVNLSPSTKLETPAGDDTGNGFGFYGEVGGDVLFVYADYQLSSVDINNDDVFSSDCP